LKMTEKSYPNIYGDEFQEIKSHLAANGGLIYEQDATHFKFDLPTPIGKIKGEIGYVEPVMKVYIHQKPFLITAKQIFQELDKRLSLLSA
jgi:hypothetical protein